MRTYTTYVACRYHVAALAPAFRFGSPLARKSYRADESIGNIFTPTHASLIDSLTHSLTLSLTYDLGILLNGRNLLAEIVSHFSTFICWCFKLLSERGGSAATHERRGPDDCRLP